MLTLKDKDGSFITSFQSYKEAHRYITHKENLRLVPGHPQFCESHWGFEVFSPEKVKELMITLKRHYDEQVMRDAWDKQVPMLDMCEGDLDKSRQIALDGSVNLEALREDWCIDYFEDHGMTLTEYGS